jgi:gliding motility-associated-like protein
VKQNDNIESAFRNAFETFEEPVNPKIWESVSQQIQPPSTGTPDPGQVFTAASKSGSSILSGMGTWIAGGIMVAATVTGYLLLSNDQPEPVQPKIATPTIVVETHPDAIIESVQDVVNNPAVSDQEEVTLNQEVSQDQVTATETTDASGTPASTDEEFVTAAQPAQNSSTLAVENPIPDPVPAAQPAAKPATEIPHAIQPSSFDKNTPIITASPSSGYAPLDVQLSYRGEAREASWMTGDTDEPIVQPDVTHTFEKPGTYIVELNTIDPDGKKHTTKTTIEVKEPSMVDEIPNVFTPNGDGINDVFRISGERISKLEGAIFNKSGGQIYRWTGTSGGWNGLLLSGETATEGTYFYVIFAQGDDERSYQFKGTVTLIR